MSNKYTDNLSIVSIKTLKGNIDSGNIDNPTLKGGSSQFTFTSWTSIERDKKLIRFVIEVIIKNMENETTPTGISASYTNEFIFKVENIEEEVDFNDQTRHAQINLDLGVVLSSIAYSTMRGIVHTRTQGTIFDGVILPIIDPSNIIKFPLADEHPHEESAQAAE